MTRIIGGIANIARAHPKDRRIEMLKIYAASFFTATRMDDPQLREVPPAKGRKRRRWFVRPGRTALSLDKL
jgi:hypothetical protein